eukprot:CAMPEP_0182443654 /NCGR_PEP_ID=MMETSP1172-20130603/2339_1 /TAXON_ID=708627 /ORGANISM="Timspurckia oligopyrenoides, Strain CCMP3278" /LENGTH=709 /DNA_ID=CAMNT_0024639007 /DNA_START=220 /DNA_END=2349 /DNA_ORIENTATION=-
MNRPPSLKKRKREEQVVPEFAASVPFGSPVPNTPAAVAEAIVSPGALNVYHSPPRLNSSPSPHNAYELARSNSYLGDAELGSSVGNALLGSLDCTPDNRDDYSLPIANFEAIYEQMRDPETGIPRSDRWWRLMTYSCCFVGSEAVTWMVNRLKVTRENAVTIGQRLLEAGILQHVTQSELFVDGYFFYRFQEDEDTPVLNMKRVWEAGRPVRPAVDVSQDLITRLAYLCEEHRLSIINARRLRRGVTGGSAGALNGSPSSLPEGEMVDYQTLAKSEEFRQYCFAAAELQRVDLFGLDHDEKLAFFVNVYNALCLHCHILIGTPTNFFRRWMFFRHMSYRVSGLDFSLDDIEHGILRGNKRPPSLKFMQQLRPSDPKVQYILKKREGRIHFVISAGTASDPPIRILDADNVEEELHFSTDEFLNNSVQVNVSKRTVTIPRIFSWYAEDFPSPNAELLKWIAQYLRSDQVILLLSMINEEKNELPTIVYENFEWSNPEARFNAAVVRKKRRRLEREKAMDGAHSPYANAGGLGLIGVSPVLMSPSVSIGNSGLIPSPILAQGAGFPAANGNSSAPGWPQSAHKLSPDAFRQQQRALHLQLQQELVQHEERSRMLQAEHAASPGNNGARSDWASVEAEQQVTKLQIKQELQRQEQLLRQLDDGARKSDENEHQASVELDEAQADADDDAQKSPKTPEESSESHSKTSKDCSS